jgi:hypothetical protein
MGLITDSEVFAIGGHIASAFASAGGHAFAGGHDTFAFAAASASDEVSDDSSR